MPGKAKDYVLGALHNVTASEINRKRIFKMTNLSKAAFHIDNREYIPVITVAFDWFLG